MVATGQDGVVFLLRRESSSEAALVMKINEEHGYMKSVDNREGRANSDHWPFHLKGVPAIFFLTKGACGDIHKPGDTYDKVPFYAYSNLFNLLLKIPEELARQEIR
jgi:Zn-dependent M28 family amino/carboxypeptidase